MQKAVWVENTKQHKDLHIVIYLLIGRKQSSLAKSHFITNYGHRKSLQNSIIHLTPRGLYYFVLGFLFFKAGIL